MFLTLYESVHKCTSRIPLTRAPFMVAIWNNSLFLRLYKSCKSECQPIFFSLRPLIKNIPDSPHQYLSVLCSGISGYSRTGGMDKILQNRTQNRQKIYASSRTKPGTAWWFKSVLELEIGPTSFVK